MAQGFNLFDIIGAIANDDHRSHNNQHRNHTSPSLARNVQDLDRYADEMVWRYGQELRYTHGCPRAKALHQHMNKHSIHTDALARAFRGTCPKTFEKAADEVRDSSKRLTKLRKDVNTSRQITYLIRATDELSDYVEDNDDRFRPVAPARPVYDPVYAQIGANIGQLNHYSTRMVNDYGREVHWNCPKSRALYQHMQTYRGKTTALNSAYYGKCPKTFKKAACDAREALTCVQKARKALTVSPQVCQAISQSCPLATYTHKNSDHFRPYDPRYQRGNNTCGTLSSSNHRPTSYRNVSWY